MNESAKDEQFLQDEMRGLWGLFHEFVRRVRVSSATKTCADCPAERGAIKARHHRAMVGECAYLLEYLGDPDLLQVLEGLRDVTGTQGLGWGLADVDQALSSWFAKEQTIAAPDVSG